MKNYKLVEVTSLYDKYLEVFYKQHPYTLKKNYEEQYNDLINDANAECNFIHSELRKIGNKTSLYFINAESLQRSWRPEYKDSSLFEIFLAQLQCENPDILLISDICYFSEIELKIIRENLPTKSKLVGWHFTIIDEAQQKLLHFFDEIYTGNFYILNLLKPFCKSVKLLRHAFDPLILEKLKDSPRQKDELVFSGSIFLGECIHNNRIDMFSSLLENKIPFDFYGQIYGTFYPQTMINKLKYAIDNLTGNNSQMKRRLITENKLKYICKSSTFGLAYYQSLHEYLVSLNLHAAIAGSGSGNMRMFEATGVGCCLLTDYKPENKELFVSDYEIVEYNSFSELVEKANWLISNPVKASEIALAGQRRTLKDYTYKNKANYLNNYLDKLL